MAGKMILEHLETKERKEMTNAEFIIFMRENPDRGLWVVAETEYTNMAGEHLREALEKIKRLEEERRHERGLHDFTYVSLIAAILGVHDDNLKLPRVPSKNGGDEYAPNPRDIITESLNVLKYTKSLADAIKLTLDRHQIVWQKTSYDYDDDDDDDYNE